MRIIQTFWSGNQSTLLNNKGGWLSEETHWMSWALSCFQAKKHYDDVELYTDSIGKHILIDVLKLPYSKVHIIFDGDPLKSYPSFLWGMAKMYTYSVQTEPFIHIDNDVFIWKKLPNNITESPLIAQNIESNILAYNNSINEIITEANYVPEWVTDNKSDIKAYNAGIIGGTDLDFIQQYTNLGFSFIEKNWNCLSKISNINIIPEQFLFYHLAKKQGKTVKCVYDKIVTHDISTSFIDLDIIPFETDFTHFVGTYKKLKDNNNFVRYTLKNYYPEYYNFIINILETNTINTTQIALPFEKIKYLDCENYVERKLNITNEIQNSEVEINLKEEILEDALFLENSKKDLSNSLQGSLIEESIYYPTLMEKENYFLGKIDMENLLFNSSAHNKIIKTKFDWDFFNQRALMSNYKKILKEPRFINSQNNFLLLIPNTMSMSIHEYGIDNFQNILFLLLKEPSSINSLIDKLSIFIKNMDDDNVRLRFENYIVRCLKKYYCLGGIQVISKLVQV